MSIDIHSDTVIIALGFFLCIIIVVALLKKHFKRLNIKTNQLLIEVEAKDCIPSSDASSTTKV